MSGAFTCVIDNKEAVERLQQDEIKGKNQILAPEYEICEATHAQLKHVKSIQKWKLVASHKMVVTKGGMINAHVDKLAGE